MTSAVRRRRDDERGMTLVELMVAVVLASILSSFAFAVYANFSASLHRQGDVAEVQQVLRAASDRLDRDLRSAGYQASFVRTGFAPTTDLRPIQPWNGAGSDGDDQIRVLYSDPSASARVVSGAATATSARVDNVDGFAEDDLVLATRTADPSRGHACVLKLTGVTDGSEPTLSFAGGDWNPTGNPQCSDLAASWVDGYTQITKLAAFTYRIKPSDPTGVLQLSPTGGLVWNDWQDLAMGVVDLQVALRVYEPGDDTDSDGDGDPERDWYSGDAMDTVLSASTVEVLQVRASLLARTTVNGQGGTAHTPDLTDPDMPPAYNRIGDQAGRDVPERDSSSRYAGRHTYRYASALVDVRNQGIGR